MIGGLGTTWITGVELLLDRLVSWRVISVLARATGVVDLSINSSTLGARLGCLEASPGGNMSKDPSEARSVDSLLLPNAEDVTSENVISEKAGLCPLLEWESVASFY